VSERLRSCRETARRELSVEDFANLGYMMVTYDSIFHIVNLSN